MPLVNADRVKETTTTTGTGTYSLDGAVAGFRTFVAGVGNGNQCHYVCTDNTQWEIGIGTVAAGTPDTLARTVILASSNAGAAVNWGAGSKDIFCAMVAAPGEARRVLARETSLIQIASSVTETDIFNQTVRGNILSTNRMLRLLIVGARFNNSGAAEAAPTLRVYTGGTVRYADPGLALANNTAWVPVIYELFFCMQDSATTMYLGGRLMEGVAGGATTGIGNFATDEITSSAPIGSASGTTFTQDTTVDWVLRVTWQNGTNNANVIFRRHYAILELL